jgi:hypothetical protein
MTGRIVLGAYGLFAGRNDSRKSSLASSKTTDE